MSVAVALPVYAPGDTIQCAPLRASMPARTCVAVAARRNPRTLGCIGCALGAEVRASLDAYVPPAIDPRRKFLSGFTPTPSLASLDPAARAARAAATSEARVSARHRDRTPASDAEVAEARQLLAAIYAAHPTRARAEAKLGLGRGTLLALGEGRCSRGTLDVLRAATAKKGAPRG